MSRKIFCLVLVAMLFALCIPAHAQQPKKIPRIGYLSFQSSSSGRDLDDPFRQGLNALGYVEGKNIIIEYRWAEGNFDRLPELAAELVRLKVDVIVARGTRSVRAAKQATSTIPIVVPIVADPVGDGLVASLAHPGGNVTGLTPMTPDLSGKRLELLKETFPKISHVAVLYDPNDGATALDWRETEVAASGFGVTLQSSEVTDPNQFGPAFAAMTSGRTNAFIALTHSFLTVNMRRLVDVATKSRLPGMYGQSLFVDAGGLMSYGPSYSDLSRRAALYVDKILKGTKPADLPVERPIKFDLVFNLKTAKQIGLTIPPNVLARADKVIR
jgi:putative tryptophan/tyrosine transport system substrate-binding protein